MTNKGGILPVRQAAPTRKHPSLSARYSMSHDVYIGLGSNLAYPKKQLTRALTALAALPGTRVVAVSSFYRTRPWGVVKRQPAYLNAVARIATTLSPEDLLSALHKIEHAQGRTRRYRFAPRTLDLDILIYGDLKKNHPRLTLPHPRLTLRAFALIPLLEIAPPHLVYRSRYEKALKKSGNAFVKRIDNTPSVST